MYYGCNFVAASLHRKQETIKDEHETGFRKSIFLHFIIGAFHHDRHGRKHQRNRPRQTDERATDRSYHTDNRTALGVVADIDGNYTLNVNDGTYTITVRYIGYKDILLNSIKVKAETLLNFEMESDAQALGEVSVVAKKNLEGERALQMERQKATLAIENLGAKEMSIKGISNVEEGVKKITGISIASAGQLIVRGLGDRYSTTTLNGLPIASPNPDNKLIPLDIFPASTVQNITVSKVYDASAFADYSGAHIDISTK